MKHVLPEGCNALCGNIEKVGCRRVGANNTLSLVNTVCQQGATATRDEMTRINSEKIAQLLRSRMPPEARVLVLKYGNYRLGGPVESLMLR